jgi:DNA-binding Xre family transcriptional regulator
MKEEEIDIGDVLIKKNVEGEKGKKEVFINEEKIEIIKKGKLKKVNLLNGVK